MNKEAEKHCPTSTSPGFLIHPALLCYFKTDQEEKGGGNRTRRRRWEIGGGGKDNSKGEPNT